MSKVIQFFLCFCRVFDRNGDGYISKSEFKHCMMHFGEKFTDDEVEEMMAEADANNDGKIDYTEFSQMILKEINMEKSKQTPPPSIAKENNESVQINGGKTASSSGSKNSTPLKNQ